jgi:16S rRNA (adenine1518-N6/adenine1519-N6)-dimethyltransferase
VESAVVTATFEPVPRVAVGDEAGFARVVRAAFGQRRKTLVNALRGGGLGSAARVAAVLADAGIDGVRRAETLSLEEFGRLADALAAPPRR